MLQIRVIVAIVFQSEPFDDRSSMRVVGTFLFILVDIAFESERLDGVLTLIVRASKTGIIKERLLVQLSGWSHFEACLFDHFSPMVRSGGKKKLRN